MGLDQQAIRVGATWQVHDPGLVVGPGDRQDLIGQHVAVPAEGGREALPDGGQQIPAEVLQVRRRPVVMRFVDGVEDGPGLEWLGGHALERGDRLGHRLMDGDAPVGK